MLVYKCKSNGWTARDTVSFGDNMQLTVSTYKSGTNVVTTARVDKVERGFLTHTVFQDFTARLLSMPCKRVTSKVVSQQQSWVSMMDVLKSAKFYYGVE